MSICKRCESTFSLRMISVKYINTNPEIYNYCTHCRKYKRCKFCNIEYHHKQNQTCSKACAEKLKENSFLESCGTSHNFCKNSKSRNNWENKLLSDGYLNVFQREDVKIKSKETLLKKYGYDHISKSPIIKKIKSEKFKNFKSQLLLKNPNHFKDNWHRWNSIFMESIGYDPRLHVFGKASKSSLEVFDPLVNWCVSIGIKYDDIYLGIDGKSEFFLKDESNFYFYDLTIRSKKIIIEFQGIFFHAKNINEEWKNPFTSETSSENIIKRNQKHQFAIDKGYRILEIWSDVPPLINLEYCKNFIENENKVN